MVFPQRFLFSMGLAGVMVALIAAGDRPDRAAGGPRPAGPPHQQRRAGLPEARQRARRRARSPRASGTGCRNAVMRRPAVIAAVTAALLVIVALPALGIRFTSVDASVLPTSASARQVSDTIDRRLPDRPQRADLRGDRRAPDARRCGPSSPPTPSELRGLPDAAVGDPADRRPAQDTWRIDVYSDASSLDPATQDLVAAIRDTPAPYATLRRRPVGELRGPEGRASRATCPGRSRSSRSRRSSRCSS